MRFSQYMKLKTAIFIFCLCLLSTHLFATAHIFLTPETQKVSVGQTFDIVVNIQDVLSTPADSTLRGASVRIDFDPSILQVVSQTEGSFLRSFGNTLPFPFHDNTAGWAQFDNSILGSGTMASGSGDLYSIRFEAVGNGTSDLVFSDIQLRNPDNYPVGFTFQNGQVFSGDAMLSFEPTTSNILIGEECTVYVKIENIVDLKGARSSVLFNASIVEVVSVSAGPFLKDNGANSTTVFTQVTSGQVVCDESIMQPQNIGVTGAGYLVEIVFRGVAEGISTLSFDTADTRLRDPDNQPLAYTTSTGTIEVEEPIAVELTSFTATPRNGVVELQWTTAAETAAAGFNVCRSIQQDERYEVINPSLIVAQGDGYSGADYTFADYAAPAGKLAYKLQEIALDGTLTCSDPIEVDNAVNAVDEAGKTPETFGVLGNYPNPFNPTTSISYRIAAPAMVTVSITDAQGHWVKNLVRQFQSAGRHDVVWDGTNNHNERVASGIYVYKVQVGDQVDFGKMLMVK